MLTYEEYRKDFLEDIRSTEESEGNGTVASYVKVCALKLFESDVLPDYTPCYFNGQGYRSSSLRVDGYAHDEHDDSFYLLVANYSGLEESEKLIGSEASQLLDRCRAFAYQSIENHLEDRLEISTEAYDLAKYISDQKKYITKFVVVLLTDRHLSDRAQLGDDSVPSKKKNSKKRKNVLEAEPIDGIEVEYRIWDMSRFYNLFGASDNREAIEIDFSDYHKWGIPCLPANTSSHDFECESWLCIVPGDVLADLYDEYGSRLMEGNVRSFLGRRGVNRDIRNTVLNEPERFFVYNNGLAATTTQATVENNRLLKSIDLQIVNGGQTTATLSSTRRKDSADLSKISVLMKLTQVKSDLASDIVPLISRSANSQNKINSADFFSTHEYHIRMEQISRRKFAPAKEGAQYETHWFYERARGQYIQAQLNLTRTEARKFATQNPKDQVVTKTDLAKALNSWAKLPHIVSKGAETNFRNFAESTEKQWDNKKDDFNDIYYQETISLVILYRSTDKMIPKQPWYDRGYKANIVTYSVALLHELLDLWFPDQVLDFQKIWSKQKCSDTLLEQMSVIAEQVYYSITAEDRPVQNVTQWCKQDKCWNIVRKLKVNQVDDIQSILIGNSERKEVVREARHERKVENTIDDQMLVLDLGEAYWQSLQSWVVNKIATSKKEIRALKYATRISEGYFPDEKQCKDLLGLRSRAVDDGFPVSM